MDYRKRSAKKKEKGRRYSSKSHVLLRWLFRDALRAWFNTFCLLIRRQVHHTALCPRVKCLLSPGRINKQNLPLADVCMSLPRVSCQHPAALAGGVAPRYAHSSRRSLVDVYSVAADSHCCSCCCLLYWGRCKMNLAFTEGRRWHINF